MVKINFNGYDYDIHPCRCGSIAVTYDAGMMGCVFKCLACGFQMVHNEFQDCLVEWNKRYEINLMVFCPDLVRPEDLDAPEAARHVRLTEVGGGEVARRSNSPFERNLQSSIKEALNKDPSTLIRVRSADAVGHFAGDPDLYGSIGGVHVEIELKVPGEKPTDLQWERLRRWADTGAACFWTDSKQEALAFQKAVLAGRGKGCVLGPRA